MDEKADAKLAANTVLADALGDIVATLTTQKMVLLQNASLAEVGKGAQHPAGLRITGLRGRFLRLLMPCPRPLD